MNKKCLLVLYVVIFFSENELRFTKVNLCVLNSSILSGHNLCLI